MDSRAATEQLTKGIVDAFEKSRRRIYTPAEQNRESCKQTRPLQWCYAILVHLDKKAH